MILFWLGISFMVVGFCAISYRQRHKEDLIDREPTRQELNLEILKHLLERVKTCPHERFGQMLLNMKIVRKISINNIPYWVDEYNVESERTLEYVQDVKKTTNQNG